MPLSWNSKGIHKWTLDEATNLSFIQINRMKLPERAELASFLQKQLEIRKRSYTRAKSYNNPYAYTKLQQDFSDLNEAAGYDFDFNSSIIKTKGRKHMLGDAYASLDNPNAKLASYIVQLQDFFQSKSSTVKGWKEIVRQESLQLFGYRERKSKNGIVRVANHIMSEEERAFFWKLYYEIRKSGRTIIYDSESMRETGYTRIWREKLKNHELSFDDMTGAMEKVLEALKANGIAVRDIEEHKPGNTHDPFQQGDVEEDDSDLFVW